MKPTETDQSGGEAFEETFLVDNEYDSLSAAAAIEHMLSLRGKVEKDDPLFLDNSTGR